MKRIKIFIIVLISFVVLAGIVFASIFLIRNIQGDIKITDPSEVESWTDSSELADDKWPIDTEIIDKNYEEVAFTDQEWAFDSLGDKFFFGFNGKNNYTMSHRFWKEDDDNKRKIIKDYYVKIQRPVAWNSYIEHVALGVIDPEATKIDLSIIKEIMLNSDLNSDELEDFWKRVLTYRIYADVMYTPASRGYKYVKGDNGEYIIVPITGRYFEFWFDYTGLEYLEVDCETLTISYYDNGEKTELYNRSEGGILWH